jgi:parallel beta-helix repeat protein
VHIEGNGNLVGGPVDSWGTCTDACNLIAGNKYGVLLSGNKALTNTIQGNFIGTNRTGTAALGNTEMGVVVTDGASDNLIGGGWETMRNLISGNGSGAGGGTTTAATTIYGGVAVNGSASTGNTVQGNYIGVQSSGEGALANQGSGVWLYQAPNNTVADNLISGNKDNGVEVVGSAATGNTVQGNTIGANQDGTVAVANGGAGVFLNGAPNNTVGGTGSGQANIISGNTGSGVKITGDGADDNVVEGNSIGVNGDLTAGLPNGGDGVFIGEGADNNQVGGTAEGAENVIAGNHSDGVELNGAGTTGNSVQGNTIGTLSDGLTRIGNWGNGVYISGGASGNLVGGVITATANNIAFNGGDGVYVAVGSGNTIRHNTVYTNTGLGIDLGPNGVTPNDAGDADSGANGLQNFPALTWLEFGGGSASVEGTLNSMANMTYTLEFFANAACDPSLHGEGRRYLGAITVATDGTGDATFVFTPTVSISTTEKVVATATDPSGNTSEFSKCIRHTEKTAVDPAIGARIVFTDTQGHPTTIDIPAGAITYTQAVTLAYTPIEEEVDAPQGFAFGHHAFELSAYIGHTPLSGLRFSPPLTVTIHYGDDDVAGMNEEELMLRYWDGSAWSEDGITVVERNTGANYVVFTVAHLSNFALFGSATGKIYLPLVLRN